MFVLFMAVSPAFSTELAPKKVLGKYLLGE